MKRICFTEDMDRAIMHGWANHESADNIAHRLNIGRSTVYRRAKALHLVAREPWKRRRGPYKVLPTVPEKAHPLVKQLYKLAGTQGVSIRDLGEKSGVCRETIGGWKSHYSPTLINIEACFNALGYELAVRKRVDKADGSKGE